MSCRPQSNRALTPLLSCRPQSNRALTPLLSCRPELPALPDLCKPDRGHWNLLPVHVLAQAADRPCLPARGLLLRAGESALPSSRRAPTGSPKASTASTVAAKQDGNTRRPRGGHQTTVPATRTRHSPSSVAHHPVLNSYSRFSSLFFWDGAALLPPSFPPPDGGVPPRRRRGVLRRQGAAGASWRRQGAGISCNPSQDITYKIYDPHCSSCNAKGGPAARRVRRLLPGRRGRRLHLQQRAAGLRHRLAV